MSNATDYEQLGAFYLGRAVSDDGATTDEAILYDAKDLTTHAVCLGMTGSGKTGLCVSLLEEAAIDGIPAIAIDPKGDLGNLLLTFPALQPADFRPWIDEGEATRAGRTPDQHADFVAKLWRDGLAEWGQDGKRIRRFRDAVDLSIYTPGSSAGRQLTLLRSFDAPPPALLEDGDALRERVQATVSGLLALLGITADPINSREHILLANVVERAWSAGRSLDLAALIREIQDPPFDKVGVFDLESFFPASDRLGLAMTLNNLLASPSFGAWLEGEPLDIQRLLYTEAGKPRLSILSIAHLSESERMFFVTLLLNEVVAWMRTQPGTQSLRALLYMDEVFGYFPPTANPPSKTPMLTLLKQARAYGLGVVLATQNPVDLDYKGLSNTGTWLLGRLQTERDKARVIEGLEGASAETGAAFDRGEMERLLAGLGSRRFLMNNVHEDAPQLFETRWALSYLRGPLTRTQIKRLNAEQGSPAPVKPAPLAAPKAVARAAAAPAPAADSQAGEAAAGEAGADKGRPVLAPDVPEAFAEVTRRKPDGATLVYRPHLVAVVSLHYANAAAKVDTWETRACRVAVEGNPKGSPWGDAQPHDASRTDWLDEPDRDGRFAPLARSATQAKSYPRWGKMLKTHVYREHPLRLFKCTDPKAISRPGEEEGDFKARLAELLREERDRDLEKLRKKYAPKLKRLTDRIRRAEDKVEQQTEQYDNQKMNTVISVGATVIGAIFGRKLGSVGNVGRAATSARRASRAAREKGDIARAEEELEAVQQQLTELQAEFDDALADVRADALVDDLEWRELLVRPRKSDIGVDQLHLVWMPWWVRGDGIAEPAHEA